MHASGSCFGLLKEFKIKLKDWHKRRNFDSKRVISDLESKIQLLDESQNSIVERSALHEQLIQAYHNEATQLKQKARLQWDIEGDGNSRFFDKMIHSRRQANNIRSIKWNGDVLINPEDIRQAILSEFKKFFVTDLGNSPFSLKSLNWYSLDSTEQQFIDRPFCKEEIWSALKDNDGKKAPGPDEFNAGWLKSLWPLLSEKILQFFQDFHSNAYIPTGANSSFIALIPKILNPETCSDFRPISLINC